MQNANNYVVQITYRHCVAPFKGFSVADAIIRHEYSIVLADLIISCTNYYSTINLKLIQSKHRTNYQWEYLKYKKM